MKIQTGLMILTIASLTGIQATAQQPTVFSNGVDVAGAFVFGNGMITLESTTNTQDDIYSRDLAPSLGQMFGINPNTGSNIVFNGDLLTLRPKILDLTTVANRQFVISAAQILGSGTLQLSYNGSNIVFSIPTGVVSTVQMDLSSVDGRYVKDSGDIMYGDLDINNNDITNINTVGFHNGVTLTSGSTLLVSGIPMLLADGSQTVSGTLPFASLPTAEPSIKISGPTNHYKFIRFENSTSGMTWDISMDTVSEDNRLAIWHSPDGQSWSIPFALDTNGVLFANGAGITNLAAGASEFTSIGNLQATTIQAAIEELDSEKLALTGGTISGNLNVATNLTVQGTISGDGSGLVNLPSSADNLGDHTATQQLNMAGYSITNATYYGDGSNLTGIINGDPSYGSSSGSPINAVFVDNNGNIGIGTETPEEKLDVDGSVKAFNMNIGQSNTVSGVGSLAQGDGCNASGSWVSHAEGYFTTAIGIFGSHAEGSHTIANGMSSSHAEGFSTTASGSGGAHAEGYKTTSSGAYGTHAEGFHSVASGQKSHAAGSYAVASHDQTFVWSDGSVSGTNPISSTADNQFTVHALNGIRLLGGPISGDGSALTNLNFTYIPEMGDLSMGIYTNQP